LFCCPENSIEQIRKYLINSGYYGTAIIGEVVKKEKYNCVIKCIIQFEFLEKFKWSFYNFLMIL